MLLSKLHVPGSRDVGSPLWLNEVRKLAGGTQTSVGDIEGLIERLGVGKLEETGRTFQNIVESMQKVVSRVQQVASAAQQIGAGSQEISACVRQQSASMQQISSSAQQLAGMAEQLSNLVAQLRT